MKKQIEKCIGKSTNSIHSKITNYNIHKKISKIKRTAILRHYIQNNIFSELLV